MAQFAKWCTTVKESVNGHEMTVLNANPQKIDGAVKVLSKLVPSQYASDARVAHLMKSLGKTAVAEYIEEKLPTSKSIRSGDLGEILGTSYLGEFTVFTQGVKRLRWKDHRNMSMRGEDVLAFGVDATSGEILVLKGEAKSRVTLSGTTVTAARKALSANKGRPSAHAISFVADRCFEQGHTHLADLLDSAQLKTRLKASQVTHLMFTFSGNDPATHLRRDLATYTGSIEQVSVGLRVEEHQKFIKAVFDLVGSNGI
ncbi:Hachiman antiphage defense system protein HamA [Achromobacter xylosoxidans]|uniref:Hachiman antiphage defense system protein HamA n=1 Tax=Alcaligenes xylosoxydans xylosoxydans TaxID=85698 RepID=UPI000D1B45FC|nr:Hachiman antiphage defense system protein HamA [Achromobacter xylosoxidans]